MLKKRKVGVSDATGWQNPTPYFNVWLCLSVDLDYNIPFERLFLRSKANIRKIFRLFVCLFFLHYLSLKILNIFTLWKEHIWNHFNYCSLSKNLFGQDCLNIVKS